MKIRAADGAMIIAAVLAGFAAAAQGADEIRAGKWQFTTQMQTPPAAQSPPGGQARPDGSPGMTLTACIDSANPVPAEAQCKLEKVERNGGNVTWAMTCNSPRGPIQSAGVARYAGTTMEATLTARVPGPDGRPVDTPGRITGRYLGACDTR